jgi:hypothetical protein
MDETFSSIYEVQSAYESELLKIEGVEGVGIGKFEDEDCIAVYVIEKTAELDEQIPKELGGYKVIMEVTGGPIEAQ